jgi:protein involved in polysaccharide export with SLBB domain
MKSSMRGSAALILMAMLGVAGCAAPPSPLADIGINDPAPVVAPPSESLYTLQGGDELEMQFEDNPELNQTVKVPPDGRVRLPYIGLLQVIGRTPDQAQAEAHARYAALSPSGKDGLDPGPGRYALHAGDDIELKFAYAPALNELVKVRPDGIVQLQLIGAVKVAGLTPEEVKDKLQQRYANYLRKPELAVILRKAMTQNILFGEQAMRADADRLKPMFVVRSTVPIQVFVGGEVQRPGTVVYYPGMTLLQAMLEAGGKLPTSEVRNVKVLRKQGNGYLVIERNMEDMASQDIALAPSDVVLVPATRVATTSQMLNEYVFKMLPFVKNSSFGFVYDVKKNP